MVMQVETSDPPFLDFASIYKTHYRRVFGLCRHLLKSSEAAEDATHEVFLRAQKKLADYDTALPLSNWLLGIASHYCIDVLRRKGLEARLFEADPVEDLHAPSHRESPLSEVLARERGNAVRDALAALPDKFRIPLVLAYYNEMSYDEIAVTLGLKKTHVATLLFRAKQQMRQTLNTQEKSDEMPQ